MRTTRQPRIVIEDLAALESLSPEEMARIFGAALQRFRPEVESLEDRELMAGGLMGSVAMASQMRFTNVKIQVDYGQHSQTTLVSPTQRYVEWAYQDLLHRSPDYQTEVLPNVNKLNNGTLTREAFINELTSLNAPGYRTGVVNDLFNHYLGRDYNPTQDNPSIGSFILTGSLSREHVVQSIVSTHEYWHNAGGTARGFFDKFRADAMDNMSGTVDTSVLLNNFPTFQESDTEEFTKKALGLEGSRGYRAQVYSALYQGYRQAEVRHTYQQYLGRAATSAEQQIAASYMQQNLPDDHLIKQILSSQEYWNRAQTRR